MAPANVFAATKKTTTTVKKAASKKTVKKVVKKKVPPKPKPSPYQAKLLIASARELKLDPGESIPLRLGFKNIGKTNWDKRVLATVGGDAAVFTTDTWAAASTPVVLSGAPLKTGRLEFYDVVLQAPAAPGSYVFQVELKVNGVSAGGGAVSVPIEVVAPEAAEVTDEEARKKPEPRIRVALGKIEGALLVHTTGEYDVATLDHTPIFAVPSGALLLWEYDLANKLYTITANGNTTSSVEGFRLQARSPDARFTVRDRSDRPVWNTAINYDEFRDTLEMRYSDKIVGLWLINELPIENYLKGLIEANKANPLEYQKALMVAARSYAYIYLPDGKSHVERLWDVHAVWDQYYKGYRAELLNPVGVAAAEATRGMVVTYNNRPVVTPYFARSDGMTRTWKAVWGGTDKPWLVPVVTQYDAGKKMFGHGVGMSQTDAMKHAAKDDWDFKQILVYYYSGTVVRSVYGGLATLASAQ